MMNPESTTRLADALRSRAAEIASAWMRRARASGGSLGGAWFDAEGVLTLAVVAGRTDDDAVAAALLAEPWGDGTRPRAGAVALVPALRLAVEEAVAPVGPAVRTELQRLLDEITLALAAMAEKRQAELERLADTDALTGALSRRAVMRELDVEAARAKRFGRPLSVLFMDADGLKLLNDSAGHAAGDEALRRLADLIERNTRLTDRLGRIGGDEFLLLLPDTNETQARIVAAKLTALAAREADAGTGLRVTIGVAGMPAVGPDPDALVSAADAALRGSKAART